jgi:NAD(P)-dependent dehydrogenase (short-subunit alcohol dehydrogenase family)
METSSPRVLYELKGDIAMSDWTVMDIPDQSGKVAIVTGTGGLGYETALELARAGADVVLAGRNDAKGRNAVEKIRAAHPHGKVSFEKLDLASLASVGDFAGRFAGAHSSLEILVNNAAVMSLPTRQTTADEFEMQFGTNYLGHFALTAHLLPLLRAGRARVVSVSSLAHRQGKILFDDLHGEEKYKSWAAYCQSKLANLMFAFELQRRSDANGWGLMSNAAHPGFARTDLIANGPGATSMMSKFSGLLGVFLSHSAAEGALPTLFAATSPDARGEGYYGPNGFYELKGPPASSFVAKQAKDLAAARRLWEISEKLTGVRFSEAVAAA